MSIKMYNGMRLTTQNQMEIYNGLNSLKKEVAKEAQKFYYETLAKYAVGLYFEYQTEFQNYGYEGRDKIVKRYNPEMYKDKMLDPWPMLSVAKEMAAANLTALHQSDLISKKWPALLDCSIELIPTEDKILMLPFTQFPKTQALIEQHPLFAHYHYWDNVEPDENTTVKEWEERKIEWESVVCRGDTMNDLGYMVTIFDANRDLNVGIDDIKEFVRTYITKDVVDFQKEITIASILATNPRYAAMANRGNKDHAKNEIESLMKGHKDPVEFFCSARLNNL